jgi:hypothetical protein
MDVKVAGKANKKDEHIQHAGETRQRKQRER